MKKMMLILLVLVILSACAPAIQALPGQSQPTAVTGPTLTVQPTATFTPRPTQTATATPYAGGGIPRIALMTQSFVDGANSAGKDAKFAIRIGYLEPGGSAIKFSDEEIFVCLQPYQETNCFLSSYTLLRWSPNGRYLAYVSPGENNQVWMNIYDVQEKKMVREVLVNRKNIYNVFDLGWSPDSAWVHAELEDYLYVVGLESELVLSASPNKVQSPRWDAEKSILYFENSQGNKFFQFDPSKNQTNEAPRQKIKPQKFKDISGWNTYGHYEPALKAETATIYNKDKSRSIYTLSEDGTPTEFLRVGYDAIQNYQDARILPAPDGNSYLFGGYASVEDRDNHPNFLFGLVFSANNLPYQVNGDFVNGILPLAWAPNSQSYLGLNFFITNSQGTMLLMVMDAASNQPLQQYDLRSKDLLNTYNFSTTVSYMQGRGVTGLDVFWPSQPEAFAPIKKPYAVYTMTPTPTEVPEWAALEKLKLYDDFSNNSLGKWEVLPGYMAEGKQVTGFVQARDGSLVFDPDAALSYAEVALRPRQVSELIAQTGIVFEARFKLAGASQNGFRFELNSGIDGQVIQCDNAWGSPDFYCGIVKYTSGPDFEYRTIPIPITVGEWHKVRIEIDPKTAAIQFYFDDALIGRRIPNDFVRLKRASYLPAITFGIGKTSAPILVDDIFLGATSGAVQYLSTFTPTPQP
jgi:WD40 repeat protein